MKFKLDENLDWRLAAVVAEGGGNEADTVKEEGLSGQQDEAIYKACVAAKRVLITLDLDFANPFRFPPEQTAGIVVLRPPRPVLPLIEATLRAALPTLKQRELRGGLWIVEPGRTEQEILADFPTLTSEVIRAIIAFAAASAEEDVPVPPVPAV